MNPSPPPKSTSADSKATSRLQELKAAGQSVWLDFINRALLKDGSLARMIAEDGLVGMTSNPAIFEKAIAGSSDYASDLAAAGAECATDPKAVFERLAIADIQAACDLLRPTWEKSGCHDGYVSLEVAPDLAHDTERTLAEARRLWAAVGRSNLMIKVPGTPAGIPAIRMLLADGINVNITLLFSVDAYDSVAAAWLDGLELRQRRGGAIAQVASVASFFISRIDTLVDERLEVHAKRAATPAEKRTAESLIGRVAIANAKIAYQHFLELKQTPRWQALAKHGAMPQRLLWASTSTKNPKFRDVYYVEELIGPETVETIPPATFDAFKDHGVVKPTLTAGVDAARQVLADLESLGISLQACTGQLLTDGVKIFKDAFDKLLAAVAKQTECPVEPMAAHAAPRKRATGWSFELPAELGRAVADAMKSWQSERKVARLWASDAKLWTGGDEASWTGWLGIVDQQRANLGRFTAFAAEVKASGFSHVCLLGMGGSSLCPEVWSLSFGRQPGFPELVVLDSTDPQQLLAVERRIDLTRTLFIVASKSGSTLEPNIFKAHFFERMQQVVGAANAGRHFVAITDPGSDLEKVAQKDGFREVFHGQKNIGGRYSALSDFGLVPAAAMGLDVGKLLARAEAMVRLCREEQELEKNLAVKLGLVLGCGAKAGRDKVTLFTARGIADLGAWIEQLIAESTGKLGRGLIPVDRETPGPAAVYGSDRLFLAFDLDGDDSESVEESLRALAHHPIVRIPLRDPYDLGAIFFALEIATAVAGEVLRIHPFDQPDVEASKIATKKLTSAFEQSGSLPAEAPFWSGQGVKLFADPANAAELMKLAAGAAGTAGAAGANLSLTTLLHAHFGRLKPGDYAAILAYVDMTATHESLLQELRHVVRDRKQVATCLGFGPRFLHSTGQAYKGGPNTALVLQITADDARDVAVPGAKYTFGIVKAAQARGDFTVLSERGRRALRVHLGSDVAAGLARMRAAVKEALS